MINIILILALIILGFLLNDCIDKFVLSKNDIKITVKLKRHPNTFTPFSLRYRFKIDRSNRFVAVSSSDLRNAVHICEIPKGVHLSRLKEVLIHGTILSVQGDTYRIIITCIDYIESSGKVTADCFEGFDRVSIIHRFNREVE